MELDLKAALRDFAYFPKWDQSLADLAELAEDEDWTYLSEEGDGPYGVLSSYLAFTYKRLAEEHEAGREAKFVLASDKPRCCFDTGLLTKHQEEVVAVFKEETMGRSQPWFFLGFFRSGDRALNSFPRMPEMAHYFDEPQELLYDTRLDLVPNVQHIVEQNAERFPVGLRNQPEATLRTLLDGAIRTAERRVRRSYKMAVPHYYFHRGQSPGHLQLLLPLVFGDSEVAGMALSVERHEGRYRAATCLTLGMAYKNARLVARPDRDWLRPSDAGASSNSDGSAVTPPGVPENNDGT